MLRIATLFLCLLLAAAAMGRYRAEVSVRELRDDLKAYELGKAEEIQKIQVLRAEVAYLENPERLSKIAAAKTNLRQSDAEQTFSANEFVSALNDEIEMQDDQPGHPDADVIKNAIAMAQVSGAQ